jgi:hypothetical protein
MAKLLIVILTIFLVADAAYAMAYKVEKKVREDHAEIKTGRNPPVIGDNYIEIEIKEAVRRCEYFKQSS